MTGGRKRIPRKKIQELEELVQNICSRPGMYVFPASFLEVSAFLSGYMAASPVTFALLEDLNPWLANKLGFPRSHGWPAALNDIYPTSNEALEAFPKLFSEFLASREDGSS